MDTRERFRREASLLLMVFALLVVVSWSALAGIFRLLEGRWWWQ